LEAAVAVTMTFPPKLELARAFDEGWQKGYRAACEHPLAVANTETDYLRARLREAESVIRLARLGYDDSAQQTAMEYLQKYDALVPGRPA
jgi:hypothetical protein